MRRDLLSVAFAALLVILLAPGVTLGTTKAEEATVQAPVAVQRINVAAKGLRDEAAMVLVGTALIGLAAAVRRAA